MIIANFSASKAELKWFMKSIEKLPRIDVKSHTEIRVNPQNPNFYTVEFYLFRRRTKKDLERRKRKKSSKNNTKQMHFDEKTFHDMRTV